MAEPDVTTQQGKPAGGRVDEVPIPKGSWPALWALVLGFFMILVDSTIVSVATPALMRAFNAGIDTVVWVTSAYLLAFAVPMLITGRLGDRIGPKRVYMIGLVVFTLSSAWCGLTGTFGLGIGWLIVARVVQGLGGSMMSPQTMTVIARIFPPQRRGSAMALWGSTAGVAALIGPILGGILIDSAGWEWIFLVNVPVGVLTVILVARLVPRLETHTHSFDWIGVALSAVGLFCAVFAIQEGETYSWGRITGIISVPGLIIVGVVLIVVFVWWQWRQKSEPLVPLSLFADRNFSVSSVAITVVGFSITAMIFPFMIYAQVVRGLNPTHAALLMAPQAVASIIMAPIAGKLVDRVHPRYLASLGLLGQAGTIFWLSRVMTPDSATWQILVPALFLGISSSFVWGTLATGANRNLPPQSAGSGSGVYNTVRQVGSVMGSAAIAVLMEARIAAHLPGANGSSMSSGTTTALPAFVKTGLSAALSDAMVLPAAVLLLGFVATLFFENLRHLR
jgi:EmrB/QacA subfamily drug resistance transporter